MLRTAVSTILAVFVASVPATAQNRRDRIEQEVLETQRAMREGKVIRANVRVTTRLKNGSRLRGVVKSGRFIERLDEREFIETDVKGPNAGLRLWYYDDTNSYIFLPYDTVAHYRIGEKLTDEEVEAIAKRIDDNRKKADAKRAQIKAAQKQPADAEPGDEKPADKPADEPAASKLTPAQKKLLEDYPPEAGWGLDKLQELERRSIVIGVFPNESEKRFIDSFAQWNEAFEIWQAEQDAKQPSGGTPAIEPPAPAPAPGG